MANKGYSQSALNDAQLRISRALAIPGESAAPDYFGELKPVLEMGRADGCGYPGSGVSRGRRFAFALHTSLGVGVATGFCFQPRVDAVLYGSYWETVDAVTGNHVNCGFETVLTGPGFAQAAGAALPADSTLSHYLERPVGNTETGPLLYSTGGALASKTSKIGVGATPTGAADPLHGICFVEAGATLAWELIAAADCDLLITLLWRVF